MHRPRRILVLLMPFALVLFGATFSAATCCFSGPNGQTVCINSDGGGGGGSPGGGSSPGGGGGGPTATPTLAYPPFSTPTPGATPVAQLYGIAAFTYSPGNCSQLNEIDPINVVFTGNATSSAVQQHAIDHGSWGYHDGTEQSFWDDGGCFLMQGQSASGSAVQLPGRFHMRFLTKTGTPLGTIAVADAHHEDLAGIGICGLSPRHVVDHEGDNGGVSGFDMGRNDIHANWTAGGHPPTGIANWPNTQPMMQCDGRTSRSDGRTAFIGIN